MALSEARIQELRNIYGKDAIILPGGNVYTVGKGYETSHILPINRRDRAEHWNAQFQNAQAFSAEWKPRPGPLELVNKLSRMKGEFNVFNMGAGLGDFTVNLAKIPHVNVVHGDFSSRANEVARQNVDRHGVSSNVRIVTMDHRGLLDHAQLQGFQPDFIFFYGGLTDNIPLEQDSAEILQRASQVVAEKGFIWYVGLQQPGILDTSDTRAIDIEGEYAVRPGFVNEALLSSGMTLVREEVGLRPDNHPLIPGHPSVEHTHVVHRALYQKLDHGVGMLVPDFGFKDAIDPMWGVTWQEINTA